MNLNEIDTTSRENIRKNGEVFTPFKIIDEMLMLIPDFVWSDPSYIFLEPTSGNGQFLLKILEKRIKHGIDIETALNTMLGMEFNNELVITSHNRIIDMVGKGFESIIKKNIILVDDSLKVIKTLPKFNKVAVIGNPPYQLNDGGGMGSSSAKPLFHLFVESVIDNIAPDYFSMIIPSRWMVGGKIPDDHRNRMMNDKRMKKIVHFSNSLEIFPTVNIKGGVNYFLWEKEHSGECEFISDNTSNTRFLNKFDIIVQDNNAVNILEKVLSKYSKWVSDKCLSQNAFGIRSDFNDFKNMGTKCVCVGNKINLVDASVFTDKNKILSKWKVCTSKGINPNKDGNFEKYNNIFIVEPNTICTETYLVVNTFDNKSEADVFMGYMKTKFFRFMLGLRVATQNISKDKFSWVPDLEDYSTGWTDKELYNHFGLNNKEISYIESKIKAI